MHHYIAIYKPYKVISLFVNHHKKKCLKDIGIEFPDHVHAVGRLDENSEGLLLITTDGKVDHLLLNPKYKHKRVYWVMVKGLVTSNDLHKLQQGVQIRVGGKDYTTLPCEAHLLINCPNLPFINRKENPDKLTSWIELSLYEGKNHQIKKMTEAVGYQTMRLVRVSIEKILLGDLKPGEIKSYSKEEFYEKLNI